MTAAYWNDLSKDRIMFDIGFGLLLSGICAGMIYLGNRALKQTKNVNNVSINVINLWIYRFVIVGLFMHILINMYVVIVQIVSCFREDQWLHKNIWFSVLICSIVKFVQIICIKSTYLMQVLEWFSILFVIKYESKEAIKNMQY